jgi:hypothetical protein
LNALATLPQTSEDLEASVQQARALFDAGDMQTARQLADLVYSSIRPLSEVAARLDLRSALEACHRIQADALEVVSYSEIRIADEWDRLAKEGKVARGRPKKSVSADDALTAVSVGMTRDQIHKARKLRDQEAKEPGFIRRVIDGLVGQGLAPSKSSIRHAIGTRSHSAEDKGDQLYQTPIEAIRTLLALESFSGVVKEPAVGLGAILRPLEAAGYRVMISDLVDRDIRTADGRLQQVGDFLASSGEGSEGIDIVTNPPYDDLANAFAAHALKEHKPRKMALLLNLNFLCGFEDTNRCFVMDEAPPSRVYVFAHRLPMMHREGWDGNKAGSQMNTAWFVWEQNDDGSYGQGYPQIIRVMWDDYQTVEPLPPGAGGHIAPMAFRDKPDSEFARQTPRRELADRVEEERARALVWIAEREEFDMVLLRRGIAVRTLLAEALIADLAGHGLIAPIENDHWKITDAGWTALKATAAVVVAKGVAG